MKARVEAGSDVAMLAAWDEERNRIPLTREQRKSLSQTLEEEAESGHLLLIHTGGDGDGPVDVYVDEDVPAALLDTLIAHGGEHLLRMPTGVLVIADAEEYRSPRAIGPESSMLTVASGDYAIRCYSPRDHEASTSDGELAELLGQEDWTYYRRTNRIGCLGSGFAVLLFAALTRIVSWGQALVLTAFALLAYVHVLQWLQSRNARYRRLQSMVAAHLREREPPTIVLVLRSAASASALRGGSVSLTDRA